MERLALIIEQLEECKRLIEMSGTSNLRMAILLEDNAAEVLLFRTMEEEFIHSGWYENMMKFVEMHALPGEEPGFASDLRTKIISASSKKKLQRYFDEKVRFLSEERKILDPSLAKALICIHRYRNDAYHNEKFQKNTLRPLAMLFHEVVCDLFVTLWPHGISMTGGEDYSWLKKKYGIKPFDSASEAGATAISMRLKEGLVLELTELTADLVEHLQQRLEGIFESLDFIAESSYGPKTREDAMKRIQFWPNQKKQSTFPSETEYEAFTPKYSVRTLEDWGQETKTLAEIEDKKTLLAQFSDLEETLEPVEELVYEAAAELDHAIQAEVDRMRGK